jgi:hypothetical protein
VIDGALDGDAANGVVFIDGNSAVAASAFSLARPLQVK